MLQSDLHDAIRLFRRGQALVGFRNGPRHGLLGIKILAGGERVEKMARVNVQRAGHDDGVDIFHVEQPAMIVECLNAGNFALRLVAAAAVDVGHGHEFHTLHRTNLAQQIVAAIADADHADANAVVRAQHGGSWIRQDSGRSQRSLFHKSAPGLIVHRILPDME